VNIRYNPSLDGLRAVAVFIVMAAHGGWGFLRSGDIGVDIFFVLSGYLITSILSAEAEARGCISLRNFYMRRVLRLAPCLVMVVAFFVISTYLLQHQVPWSNALIALTYTANWAATINDDKLNAVAHCWSLATEEQYYLIWPFVIALLERTQRGALTKGLLLLNLALLFALYRFSMVGTFSAGRIYFGLDTHIDGLILGSALSYLLRSGINLRFAAYAVPPSLIGLALIPHFLSWRDPLMGKYGFALVAVMSALIITTLVTRREALITRLLRTRPLVFIGRISYGLYLWHLPIFVALAPFLPHASFRVSFLLKLAVTLTVACASYYLVELPFLRLKRRFDSRSNASPATFNLPAAPGSANEGSAALER
jgi:peptidoglycan/LPS O-acetylase OafA/YrhL